MMSDLLPPPGLIMIAGAFLLPLVAGRVRTLLIALIPLVTLAAVWMIPADSAISLGFLDYTIHILKPSAEGRLFATIFSIMAFTGAIYAIHHSRLSELVAGYVYAGSAIGVTFAGDLITLFVFWEVMALGSTMVLWSAHSEKAYSASMRYLILHLLGGIVLMSGIVAQAYDTGSIAFVAMQPDSIGTSLILAGFLLNAGAPPFSAWIADAYPEASPGGTVFLSAFTTKTAVFALLIGFPGVTALIYIGLFMVFYGIIYALLENDMRRILAYSIVNQVGFMVCAIGIGTELALNGAAAHAFAHIIYKGLLMMSAGSVLLMAGKRKCSDLGGLFQSMPVTAINGIIGALAISAMPYTSGFVTKSLATSAAAHEGLFTVWMLLIAASAGVFLHAGIKFPWFVFFQKDSGLRPADPPANMRWSMWLFSFLCITIGVFPELLYRILPYSVDYQPYTGSHLVTQFQLLLFAGFAFFALLPMMKRTLTISLDFDWFYRKFFRIILTGFSIKTGDMRIFLENKAIKRSQAFIGRLYRHHGPHGILARTWPSGSMVLWVAIMLAGLIVGSAILAVG